MSSLNLIYRTKVSKELTNLTYFIFEGVFHFLRSVPLLKVICYILSIQVDGGSEFRAEFEEACADLESPLLVLPPRKLQYNGGVERGNRTFQEEFYANPKLLADSIGYMRFELSNALTTYNTYRPHFNLKGTHPYAVH